MPKTLLLADDSVVIQKLVGLSFANEDVELVTTDNGDDALARASEARPDLVLADVVMPGKNGYEVCEAIKADPELAGTPVLLLTGTFEAFDEARARSAGADGHITKPFEAQVLVERVNELLARASAAPGPAEPAAASAATPSAQASDDGYDFFDSNVDDLSSDLPETGESAPAAAAAAPPPTPGPAPAPAVAPAPTVAPPMGGPGSASDSFSFDDDGTASATGSDLDPLDPLASPLGDGPEPLDLELDDDPAGDRTVALMPDGTIPAPEPERPMAAPPERPAVPPATPAETAIAGEPLPAWEPEPDLADTVVAEEGLELDAPRSAAASTTGSDLDFGEAPALPPLQDATVLADDLFETSDGGPMSPPIPDPSLSLDFQSTPEAGRPGPAADYDVSSSDLGDPLSELAPELPSPSAPAPGGAEEPWPAPPVATPEPARAEPRPEPPVAVAPAEPPRPAPVFAPEADEVPPTVVAMEDTGIGADASDTTEPDAGTPLDLEPEPEPEPAGTAAPAPGPDLTPMMRERIHETLEKVAWEAFSDVSDTLVKQVLARVEAIAWEVIPKMAETLIEEEIRRMKEGTGDE